MDDINDYEFRNCQFDNTYAIVDIPWIFNTEIEANIEAINMDCNKKISKKEEEFEKNKKRASEELERASKELLINMAISIFMFFIVCVMVGWLLC